jgi:hypothetical protein
LRDFLQKTDGLIWQNSTIIWINFDWVDIGGLGKMPLDKSELASSLLFLEFLETSTEISETFKKNNY